MYPVYSALHSSYLLYVSRPTFSSFLLYYRWLVERWFSKKLMNLMPGTRTHTDQTFVSISTINRVLQNSLEWHSLPNATLFTSHAYAKWFHLWSAFEMQGHFKSRNDSKFKRNLCSYMYHQAPEFRQIHSTIMPQYYHWSKLVWCFDFTVWYTGKLSTKMQNAF